MPTKPHPGAVIRRARRAIEMTQRELGESIGRSLFYICTFELGRADAPPEEVAAMRAAIKARRAVVRS
jgi:hypothetical protein